MSFTARRTRVRAFAGVGVVLAALTLAAPAYASGKGGGGSGGGGGGGATSVGAIQSASAAVSCDGGTTGTVSVKKGFDKRVEVQISRAGTATGQYLNFQLANDLTGTNVARFGSWPSSASSLTTILGGTVAPGPVELSYTMTVHEGTSTAGAVLETCTAHISTIAK